jgi:hypothetical protein
MIRSFEVAMSHSPRTTIPILAFSLALACSPEGVEGGSIFTVGESGLTLGNTATETGGQTGDGDGDPGDGDGDGDGTPGDGDGDGVKLDTLPNDTVDDGPMGGEGCQFIDVLFIVDISASMSEEKANLNANFPMFVDVLDDYIADPNTAATAYRLGLTNSSIVDNLDGQSSFGLDGALYDGAGGFGPDCNFMGKLWIDGPAPSVSDSFSCAAPLPKSDCNSCTDIGKERPLDTIEMFIEKSAPAMVNEGFYRGAESLFVVVILSDEDDDASNSTTTPAQTKAALDTFADGEERYVVVTIAGPQNGGCDSNFGSAAAAPTLHEFTNAVPNGVLGDICQGDLAQSLEDALAVIVDACDTLPPPVG